MAAATQTHKTAPPQTKDSDTRAAKTAVALSPLEASLAARAPSEDWAKATLGRNRKTGFVRDPFRCENVPARFITKAISRAGGYLAQARLEGWIPFQGDQMTRDPYDTDKVYMADYDVSGDFVVVGGDMVMCYADKRMVDVFRADSKARWNAQLSSRLGIDEAATVKSQRDADPDYRGGFTSESGNQALVGYAETNVNINPDNPTDELFRSIEGD